MLAALCGIAANAAVGGLLVGAGLGSGLGISAVGLANAAGQAASAIVLLIFAAKRIPGLLDRSLLFAVLKLLLGGALVFAVCAGMKLLLHSSPFEASFLVNVGKAAAAFLPAAVVYLVYSKLVKPVS